VVLLIVDLFFIPRTGGLSMAPEDKRVAEKMQAELRGSQRVCGIGAMCMWMYGTMSGL
jgi:hypothetical protein